MKSNRWLLVAIVVAFYINACAKPSSYIADTKILSPEQYSSENAPEVRVRLANPDEIKELADFPGKKDFERANRMEEAVNVIMLPVVLPFASLFLLDAMFNPNKGPSKAQQKQQALEQFPNRLTAAIEQCFMLPPPSESPDILEVVYFADYLYILDTGKPCFVVHAQITFQSKEEVLFREILRIDPRVINDDNEQTECTEIPYIFLEWADDIIPRMIQTRVPGLPWKPKS